MIRTMSRREVSMGVTGFGLRSFAGSQLAAVAQHDASPAATAVIVEPIRLGTLGSGVHDRRSGVGGRESNRVHRWQSPGNQRRWHLRRSPDPYRLNGFVDPDGSKPPG